MQVLRLNFCFRKFSFKYHHLHFCRTLPSFDNISLDWDYLCNSSNHKEIIDNCERRGVKNVSPLLERLNDVHLSENRDLIKEEIQRLHKKLLWLPNKTHPRVFENLTENPILLEKVGTPPPFDYHPAKFDSITKRLNLTRVKFLGRICGKRAYYLKGDLSNLEKALINYTLERLSHRGFKLVSVPDIVNKSVIEKCGMKTKGERAQVFHVDESWSKDLCLSGTAEMSLAAFCAQKKFPLNKLPLRLCSVSRCFRAEAKSALKEKGIYRVHCFTKVEMFGVTSAESGSESEELLEEFKEIQKSIFSELGLHFQVLEMPSHDLGLPAYRKIDIEAWMPGRNMYGEISSASNCTDYQSRRLDISYSSSKNPQPDEPSSCNSKKYCHTVNGTACAIPRMLIAIFENFQNFNETINIPTPLQKYMEKELIQGKFRDNQISTKPVT